MRLGIAFLILLLMLSAAVAGGIYLLVQLSRRSASDDPEA